MAILWFELVRNRDKRVDIVLIAAEAQKNGCYTTHISTPNSARTSRWWHRSLRQPRPRCSASWRPYCKVCKISADVRASHVNQKFPFDPTATHQLCRSQGHHRFAPGACDRLEPFLSDHIVGQELAVRQFSDAVCDLLRREGAAAPGKPLIISGQHCCWNAQHSPRRSGLCP